ncbi:CinA family protein [Saccharothrix violaceirubra]|uniref:Nicotinamide-nucleotide amidase n=1 Tax=Saccharothrix violaceirubra TaxID=413306 RepID=A0A7W7T025_9PSEU|nr:CinA family protein [Saccharothrix violaceirubra]MBB4964074.1 nicotinamide-nucleotide amidase [Saccharothrix violaceirubra]
MNAARYVDTLTSRVVDTLKLRGETVATAESLTAGLVTAALTEVPGASAVVRGGLVVYATDLKHALAGVDSALLSAHGAVHSDVAAQLAQGARTRCDATWGIGLTGVAGPDPQDGVAPGTVHIGVSGPDGTTTRTITVGGGRAEVRAASVVAALDLLLDRVKISRK